MKGWISASVGLHGVAKHEHIVLTFAQLPPKVGEPRLPRPAAARETPVVPAASAAVRGGMPSMPWRSGHSRLSVPQTIADDRLSHKIPRLRQSCGRTGSGSAATATIASANRPSRPVACAPATRTGEGARQWQR